MKVELNSGIHILKKGFILLCILLYSCTQEALEQIKAPEPSGWTEEEVASLLAFKVGRFEYNTNTGNNFDNTAIAILNHIPSDKSTDVNVAEKVTVEFSEALDANSINENTVILSQNGTRISANTSVEGKILRITPTSPLSYDTNYTLLLTTGIKDEKGNQIQSDYSFQFHTAQKKDSIPPEITATDPVSGQTGILSGHTILVTFSEELSADSVSADTIQITTDTGNIDKNYTVSGNVLQIIASPYLPTQKKISLSIKKEISDLAGNPMSSDYEFFFYTADDIPPTVKATNPTNNASMVSPNSKISILFSEVLDYNTVNAATVLFQKDGVPVEATIELKDDTIWISPLSSLELTANYTVTLTGGLKDLYGNALAENYTFSFQSYSLNLQVAAGYTSTCAIIPPGNLKCWGMGSFGILGNGDTANILSISEAVRLNFGFFITVEQVSVGISHACAVLSNKKVKCWGDGAYGKLGDPNISEIIDINEALYLPFPEDIVQIQTGSFSTCALSVSGKVYCFGINFNGQLGNSNNLDITDASKAIPISFNPKAIKISSG
ncbi:MAG: Ig-like domain-containing protein, partial [Leptospiraceae bacterium]|nr:Ig-like domain-containing protein [Leptospiraceae bacterium]